MATRRSSRIQTAQTTKDLLAKQSAEMDSSKGLASAKRAAAELAGLVDAKEKKGASKVTKKLRTTETKVDEPGQKKSQRKKTETKPTVVEDTGRTAATGAKAPDQVADLKSLLSKEELDSVANITREESKTITDTELTKRLQNIRCATRSSVKVTNDRIYSMRVHPDATKFLVAAGSKTGELSVWDASAYAQEWREGNPNGPTTEEDFCVDDSIIRSQYHSQAITGMYFSPADTNKVVTGSHDGTIRLFDVKSESSVASLAASDEALKLTSLDFNPEQPHIVYFSCYDGHVGYHDIRTSGSVRPTAVYRLSKKKIGNMALNPAMPHIFSTSSPDRTVKLWDLRSIKQTVQYAPLHQIKLSGSASSGHWDSTGTRMVTTSFEDALRVFDTSALLAEDVDCTVSVPQISQTGYHNCRTGQHVTILQGRFHPDPLVGNRIVTVADMDWGVKFYSSKTGLPLINLQQKDLITASPAVLAYHPLANLGTSDFGSGLACGNASGRVFIMM